MKGTDSDLQHVEQLKAGNKQALSVLFNEYYQPLCRFVYVYIPENEVVEELTANVFIYLWENREKLAIHTSLRSYLYRSARNQAISYLRKKKSVMLPLDEELDLSEKKDQTPEAIYIESELNTEFSRAFRKLPARAKLAFKLHRIDGLKYAEVADIMNISIAAVEKNISSALKLLRQELFSKTEVQ